MSPTTEGRFRVLASPRDSEEWLFLRVDQSDPEATFEPTYVPREGHGDLQAAVDDLRAGYLVDATVEWDDGTPIVADLTVRKETVFEFVDDATNLFEAAESTWQAARMAGEAMNSQVTYSTNGDPNGVLYVFAQQSGAQDLFEEFRSGVRPLEPLLERVNENDPDQVGTRDPDTPTVGADGTLSIPTPESDEDGPDGSSTGDDDTHPNTDRDPDLGRDREVFVMRPADHPFVLVYIVLRKGGLLADTMRDTYHC